MLTTRRGTDLRIHIRLALLSLGLKPVITKRMSIAELEAMLTELRREQIERGIIKRTTS